MAWSFANQHETALKSHLSVEQDRLPEELLAPVLFGAYVRGIADAFDLMGVPAFFLDRNARILGVNAVASLSFGSHLRIEADHIVAATFDDNLALSGVVASAVSGQDGGVMRTSAVLPTSNLVVHALSMRERGVGGQLLEAIVFVISREDTAALALVERMTNMSGHNGFNHTKV